MKAIILLILCAGLVPVSTTASAATPGAMFAPQFIQQTNKHTTLFVSLAEELRSTPREEWEDHKVQAYLTNALWAVYSAYFAYSLEREELPTSSSDVVNSGHLAVWPLNPFNDWQPMQLLDGAAAFSAGDMTLQVCPAQYYSLISGGVEAPMSYELGIFGPTQDYAATHGHAEPYEDNAAWAVVPPGTMFMLGGYAESAASSRARLAEREGGNDE